MSQKEEVKIRGTPKSREWVDSIEIAPNRDRGASGSLNVKKSDYGKGRK